MEFSEKLSALLSLTATKNVMLARALEIDTAQISRLKKGTRKMPAKLSLVQGIAGYFAGRFDSEYRLSALYELTGDVRLHTNLDESTLTKVIYEWLIAPNSAPKSQISRFLDRFGTFSMEDIKTIASEPETKPLTLEETGFVAYYNNEGKRQAVRELAAYVLSLNTPCTIRVFTDECMDWIIEDNSFTRELAGLISQCVKKGCKFQRIQPPAQNSESIFRSIERWLPAYFANALKLFYSPWSRDDLHRRTIFVVPGHIALHSDSLSGQKETPMTILTTDLMTVRLTDEHYSRILERCHPAMAVHTVDTAIKPADRYERISAVEDTAICKPGMLSILAIPPDLITQIRRRGTATVQRMFEDYTKNAQARAQVLENKVITDILCLPDLDEVLKNTVPIPGTKISPTDWLYYTPEEYQMHLEYILWYMDTYPNYHVILLDKPLFDNVTVYVKGNCFALLIRENDPFALFEVTEQALIASLHEHLWRLIKETSHIDSRQTVAKRLRSELKQLKKAMKKN